MSVAPNSARPWGIEMDFELTVRGPVLIKSSESGPWGVDAVCLRDAEGRLVIPGSHILGRLREAFEQFEGEPFDGQPGRTTDSRDRKDRSGVSDRTGGRYPLFVTDFVSHPDWPAPGAGSITSIAMDAETGSAKEGAFRVLDCPVQPGDEARFRGSIRFFSKADNSRVSSIAYYIKMSLDCISALGGNRTVGFGRLLSVTTLATRLIEFASSHPHHDGVTGSEDAEGKEENQSTESGPGPKSGQGPKPARISISTKSMAPPVDARLTKFGKNKEDEDTNDLEFDVEWTLHDPFCVPWGTINSNIFESETKIRGDAIKGAIAATLKQVLGQADDLTKVSDAFAGSFDVGFLARHFDLISLSTARPCRPGGIPGTVIPESIVVADGRVCDLALTPSGYDDGLLIRKKSPAFSRDWKPAESKLVEAVFPEISVTRQLRVRTAVNSKSGTASESELFAQRVVQPKGFVWRGRVVFRLPSNEGFNRADMPVLVNAFRSLIETGWLHLGKTHARMSGRLVAPVSIAETQGRWNGSIKPVYEKGKRQEGKEDSVKSDVDNLWVVTLQSPALLVDSWKLVDKHSHIMHDVSAIDREYEEMISEMSGSKLTLVRRYTRHDLVGGFRAWQTRRRDWEELDAASDEINSRDLPYYPILLTDAGSVFVVKASGDVKEATRVIEFWSRHGISIKPQDAGDAPGVLTWVQKAYGSEWKTNPFLPGNGYGEVSINMSCHRDLLPLPSELS